MYYDGKVKQHYIHRLVAQAFITNLEGKLLVDHCDGDKTNNCVSNLRWATKSENNMNQQPQRKMKHSKFKGVSFHKQSNRWRAYINMDGSRTELGLFSNETEAAHRYNEEAIKRFKKFALLNKIE